MKLDSWLRAVTSGRLWVVDALQLVHRQRCLLLRFPFFFWGLWQILHRWVFFLLRVTPMGTTSISNLILPRKPGVESSFATPLIAYRPRLATGEPHLRWQRTRRSAVETKALMGR